MESDRAEQRNFNILISLVIVGLLVIITWASIIINISALLQIFSILFFYSFQIGLVLVLVGSILGIFAAIRKHTLGDWTTYIPIMILIVYVAGIFLMSHFLVFEYAIPTKITNPDNRGWSEAMVGRAFGGWESPACVLGDRVGALIGIWSFVTPDGHMPVLTYAEKFPGAELLGRPTSCSQLQENWYICYLGKPYELINKCH